MDLNFVKVKLVSLPTPLIFLNPLYTDVQQFTISLKRFSTDLSFMNMAFQNYFSVSNMWGTGSCSNHIISIAIYLLNELSSLEMLLRNCNGGIE